MPQSNEHIIDLIFQVLRHGRLLPSAPNLSTSSTVRLQPRQPTKTHRDHCQAPSQGTSCLQRLGTRAGVLLLLLLMSSCLTPPAKPPSNYVGPPRQAVSPAIVKQIKDLPKISDPRTITPLLPVSAEGPLQVSLSDAILLGLDNNYSFQLDKFNPEIQATLEEQERALFDPVSRAASRAFWPSRPMARDSWWSGTMTRAILSSS